MMLILRARSAFHFDRMAEYQPECAASVSYRRLCHTPVVAAYTDVSRSVMVDVAELWGCVFRVVCAGHRRRHGRRPRDRGAGEDAGRGGGLAGVRHRNRPRARLSQADCADMPVDRRRVQVRMRARRLRCEALGCPRQTFREQAPGVLVRYQRLTGQVSAIARELAGRASARLLPALGIAVSWHTVLRVWHTVLRVLLRIPCPPCGAGCWGSTTSRCAAAWSTRPGASTPRPAGGLDTVEPRRRRREKWLRAHPGAGVVCRDGPWAYGEAVR